MLTSASRCIPQPIYMYTAYVVRSIRVSCSGQEQGEYGRETLSDQDRRRSEMMTSDHERQLRVQSRAVAFCIEDKTRARQRI